MKNLLSLRKDIPVTVRNRVNPFLSLQDELTRAMKDFGGWFEPFHFPTERFENLALNPAMDIVDDEKEFKVELEMPGMGEEDIKVSIDHGVLTIKGEKSTSQKDKGKNYMVREIGYGSYERCLALPDSVDVDKAAATFRKGMLWVVIPKKPGQAQKTKTIEVKKA